MVNRKMKLLCMVCVLAVEEMKSCRYESKIRPQWQAFPGRTLRLRGGETSPERALGKREAVMFKDGGLRMAVSHLQEEVVFPRDCNRLPLAIRMCCDQPTPRVGEVEGEPWKSKAARWARVPAAAGEKSDACRGAGEQDATCPVRRLLILFGHHEIADEVLRIRRMGAWSIRGIGTPALPAGRCRMVADKRCTDRRRVWAARLREAEQSDDIKAAVTFQRQVVGRV